MQQVEIIVEELKSETIKEFERIKNEACIFANSVKNNTKNRVEIILELLKHDINELLKTNLDKQFVREIETLYKRAIKDLYSAQETAWTLLNDKTAEYKTQIKKCFEYACEIVDKRDKTLEKAYQGSKDFLKSNMKEISKDVKKIGISAQEQVLATCKNAKRRMKV